MWTIGSILKWTQDFFGKKGIDSPRLDAEVLLAHTLKKDRIHLYVDFDEPLTDAELAAYRELVKERARRIPVAYLVGCREFMGLSFKTTKHTLIPRPETEVLVLAALDNLKRGGGEKNIADIGTGTGAIALSLLRYLPTVSAVLTDISKDALEVAKENAASLKVEDRAEFFVGDLTEPLQGKKFDAILANPPYVSDADMETLAPEVLAEPHTALAGGADGMDFYRRLANDAPQLLNDGGFICVEVGAGQARDVAAMFAKNPLVESTQTAVDLARIERAVTAWKQKR